VYNLSADNNKTETVFVGRSLQLRRINVSKYVQCLASKSNTPTKGYQHKKQTR